MAQANLSNLPVEVLHRIFYYSDARTILYTIRFVCKRLRNVVDQYNQIELELNWRDLMYFCRPFPFVPPHVVASLIISFEDVYISEDETRTFIFYIHRFTHIQHLSLRGIKNESLQLFLKDANYMQLVSLTIDSQDKPNRDTCSRISSIIEKSNLRKLCLPKLRYEIDVISWSHQCQLTHLTVESCRYSQYPAILQQLPYLKTLGLNNIIMDSDKMSIGPINSQLTCLIIKDCSLSIQQLKLLLSTTSTLRDLSIGFYQRWGNPNVDIYDWEEFVRTELNILNRLEFCFYHKLSSNITANFDSIIVPFREPFWLNEKHWFVACEYIFDKSDYIIIYTIPNTLDIYNAKSRSRINGILFKQNNYYLTKCEKNNPVSIVPCDKLVELDLSYKGINAEGAKYLAHGLKNNQILATLDLTINRVKASGIKCILDALQNNTTFTTLNLYGNHIGDEGVQYVSTYLRNNRTLTTLDLSYNEIKTAGFKHLAQALQNNTTLTKLVINNNSIGEHEVDHIASLLETNTTLTTLHMNSNKIGIKGTELLCKALQKNTTLKEIDLCNNEIGDDGAKFLAQVLQNNTVSLEKINLESNNIGDDGAQHLALALRNNTTVTTLDLAWNKIKTRGGKCLLNELQHNTTLTDLCLSQNPGGYCHAVGIYIKIKNNPSLTEISNRLDIGDEGAKLIADIMRNNTTLQKLELIDNSIGAKGAKYLADALRENTTLKTLNLKGNCIDAEGVDYLKKTLKDNQKSTLTTLILYEQKTSSRLLNLYKYLEVREVAEVIRYNDELLTRLELSGRYLGPAGAKQIANALRSNTTLKALYIDAGDNIGLAGFKYFIDEFKNQTTRIALYFTGGSFKKSLCIDIVNKIQTDQTLAILEIKDQPIVMNGIIYLSHAISYHSSITTLNLINNQMAPCVAIYVANIIKNNTTLTTLCFEMNPIDDKGMIHLASTLQTNQTLKTLILSRNGLEANGTKYLADALQTNTALSILRIKNNRIGDEGTKCLADMLKTNKTLTEIDLTNNQIGNNGAQFIANALLTNNTLLKLSLENNQIEPQGFKDIAEALEKNETLTILNIGKNNIGIEGAGHLAHALTINRTIKEINLSHNRIGEQGAQHLIGSLQNNNVTLTKLCIESNQISQQTRTRLNEILQTRTVH